MKGACLLLLVLVCGCQEPPLPPTHSEDMRRAKEDAELEAASLCVDTWFNLANSTFGGSCPRSDQKATFEKDTDGDANLVCRCYRREPCTIP